MNTYVYAVQDPIQFIDTLGLAERGGGRAGMGGDDPLIPKGITKNTPKAARDAAIRELEEVIKKTPGLGQRRLAALRAWIKVAKRGFTKGLTCPLILDDLVKGVLEESCALGDALSCQNLVLLYPEDFDDPFGI